MKKNSFNKLKIAQFDISTQNYSLNEALDHDHICLDETEKDVRQNIPDGTIWHDVSSYKDDGKYDFYMKFDEWKFIGRFRSWTDAFESISTDEKGKE